MTGRPSLYISIEAGDSAQARLADVLTQFQVASVLIKPLPGGTLTADASRSLVALAQAHDAAALLLADATLARALRADGVHLPVCDNTSAAYETTRDILGRRYIVGAEPGPMRHDAMVLGEAGAEYLGFDREAEFASEPDVSGDFAVQAADAAWLDRIRWWSEIFEIPCVALGAREPGQMLAAAHAGADFVEIFLPSALDRQATIIFVEAAEQAIAEGAANAGQSEAPR